MGAAVRFRTAPAIAAVLLTAACASTAPTAAPAKSTSATRAPASASPTVAQTRTSPSPTPSAAAGHGSNITLSTQAGTLPPGPFRITPVSCGPYTKAEQQEFGTNGKGGLVYRYTNVSNSLTGAPSLEVDFLNGSDVLGSNVTGSAPDIGPGQSAEGYVDALDGSGNNLNFTSCELMQYGLRGTASGTNFAP